MINGMMQPLRIKVGYENVTCDVKLLCIKMLQFQNTFSRDDSGLPGQLKTRLVF